MKTESDLKLEYLSETGIRAYVEDAGEAFCPECEETINTGDDGVNLSREYYEWLIERINEAEAKSTKKVESSEALLHDWWNDALEEAINEIEMLKKINYGKKRV